MDKNRSGGAMRAETAVVGAGASGCMAAVSAALAGCGVMLIDANDKIARKIYATGNGRCNLTNLHMAENCYHAGGGEDLSAFFARFSVEDHMRFWEERGVLLHDRQGYVYPLTDQASTIAEAYEKILRQLGVRILLGERVTSVKTQGNGPGGRFEVRTDKGSVIRAGKVILAGGGMAGPQYGCSGDLYRIAGELGHTVVKPLPALVPLLSGDKTLKASAGARCDARIRLCLDQREAAAERGELQMTEKGISGIPVFQLSAQAARALDRGVKVEAVIDFLPDMDEETWKREKDRRLGENRNCMLGTFFLGLVNRKILDMILRRRGLQAENKASKLPDEVLSGILEDMRAVPVGITGTAGFRQAQVTSGGIPLAETDGNLQSLTCRGLYLAGELLDVDGICGGYNLQWAAASGWIAGRSAAAAQDQRHKE